MEALYPLEQKQRDLTQSVTALVKFCWFNLDLFAGRSIFRYLHFHAQFSAYRRQQFRLSCASSQ